MPSNRIGRINEEIQRELADQLRRLKDPRVSQVGMVSITRVDTTSDLRYARVYIRDRSISVFWTRTRRKTC